MFYYFKWPIPSPYRWVISSSRFYVLSSLEYILLRKTADPFWSVPKHRSALISTFVHYFLRWRFYIHMISLYFCHGNPPFRIPIGSATSLTCSPPIPCTIRYVFPLSPFAIAMFLSPISHPSKWLSSLPVLLLRQPEIQCYSLHADKQSSWLLPWDWKCHLHQTGAWNSNCVLELGFQLSISLEKEDKKYYCRQISWV